MHVKKSHVKLDYFYRKREHRGQGVKLNELQKVRRRLRNEGGSHESYIESLGSICVKHSPTPPRFPASMESEGHCQCNSARTDGQKHQAGYRVQFCQALKQYRNPFPETSLVLNHCFKKKPEVFTGTGRKGEIPSCLIPTCSCSFLIDQLLCYRKYLPTENN